MRVLRRSTADSTPAIVPRELLADIRRFETVRLWATRLAATSRPMRSASAAAAATR
ncbi:MAG TPA: hypothetical protein VHW44_23560 [Pseudonocardiaceae bacterium]|nr:hypothetical protein [Pseudonocardiaceae bacterium]